MENGLDIAFLGHGVWPSGRRIGCLLDLWGDTGIVLLYLGSWSSGIGLGCLSHTYVVLVFLVMLEWVWLVHSKGLVTLNEMVKTSSVWVHTHWISTNMDGHACVEMTSTGMQAHGNLSWEMKIEFLEDKLYHWIVKKTHGKVLKWKLEEIRQVGQDSFRRGTWKSINKRESHSFSLTHLIVDSLS